MQLSDLTKKTDVVRMQQKWYQKYALAVEKYVKKSTMTNWEKKEKAFEIYNALLRGEKDGY